MKQRFNLLATQTRLLTFFVLMCISASAMAQDSGLMFGHEPGGYVVSVSDDTKTTYTVPSTYHGEPVIAIRSFKARNMVTINLPSSVKQIRDRAFQGCEKLANIDLSNITFIGASAFEGCTSLTSVDLSSATKIYEDAFSGCTGITSFVFPTNHKLTLPSGFARQINLPEITIGSNITMESNAFWWIEKVTINGDGNEIYAQDYNYSTNFRGVKELILNNVSLKSGGFAIPYSSYYDVNGSRLETLKISNCSIIGRAAFMGHNRLATLELSNVQYIMDYSFANCTALTSVSLDRCSVKESSFAGCTSLKRLSLRRMPTDSDWSFRGNTNIETVMFYSTENIPNYAFNGCTNLTKVEGVLRRIGNYAFAGCSKLTDLDASLRYIGEGAFSGCTSLTTFGSCFSLETIEAKAFENCTSLTGTLTLDYCSKIGENAFENCTNTGLVFDYIDLAYASVGAFKGCCGKLVCESDWIPDYTFASNKSPLNGARFTEVEFKNMTELPKYLLYNMPELKTVNCEKLTSVESLPELSVNCPLFNKLYVNNGTLKTFGSDAEGWAIYSADRRTLQYVPEGVEVFKTINGDVITLNANFAKHIKPGTGEAYCSLHMLDMTANRAQTIRLENLSATSVLPVAVKAAYGTRDKYVNVIAAGMGLITDYIKGDVDEDGKVTIADANAAVNLSLGK